MTYASLLGVYSEEIDRRWTEVGSIVVQTLGSILLDIVYPPLCAGCDRRGTWVCDRCLAQVPRYRHRFAVAVVSRIACDPASACT